MEGVKDLLPVGSAVGLVVGLIVLGIRLIFRGGLVPRVHITDTQAQHEREIAAYERIITLYKDSDDAKQKTIDTLSASVDKLAEAQNTTNALIKGLVDVAETNRRLLAAGEPLRET